MLKVVVKTDRFASRMIKNGQRRKRRAMLTMGYASRYALRDVVRKRKNPSKPGRPPADHGTYRNTIRFEVSEHSGEIRAGFADYKAKGTDGRKSKTLILGNNLAQDALEYGGQVRMKIVYRDKRKNAPAKIINIQARPHVSVAKDRLFFGNKAYSKRFKAAQQDLIDQGYLRP